MGYPAQSKLNERGERVKAHRITHDLSTDYLGLNSVNSRIDETQITPYIYGRALNRILRNLITMRRHYPHWPIMLAKSDYKSAYRRLHHQGLQALLHCVQTADLTSDITKQVALIALRLTFGGRANPSLWSDVSEVTTDVVNALTANDGWETNWGPTPTHINRLSPPETLSDDMPRPVR
jgi:hypothetical protein